MDMNMPPLKIKIMIESNPQKSGILGRILAVVKPNVSRSTGILLPSLMTSNWAPCKML